MTEFKFLTDVDRQLYEWQLKADGGDRDLFINRRQGLIKGLKDFRKSQSAKGAWRHNRWGYMKGIKRFHKSTQGKKFHRMLGRYLANRYSRTKETSGMLKHRQDTHQESYDLSLMLSSMLTHAALERAYWMEIVEAADYELFMDEVIRECGSIFKSIDEGTYDFAEYEEFFLRICEPRALLEAFVEASPKESIYDADALWAQAESGKTENDENYLTLVVRDFLTMLG